MFDKTIENELKDLLALWRLYRRGYFDYKEVFERFKVQFDHTAGLIRDHKTIYDAKENKEL